MSEVKIPEVLPVATAAPLPTVLPVLPVRPAHRPPARGFLNALWRLARFVGGWLWRLLAGAALCFNYYILSYLTSIVVVGWTYRWMQARVLRRWWKQSPRRHEGSFEDFCDSLGPYAPVPRPRWFLQERLRVTLTWPGPRGVPAGPGRLGLRLLRSPWYSLWLNFKIGLQGLFCTYLLTGWGCLMMLSSWEFGWLNSFHKGYEEALIGLLTGMFGSLLLIVALFYVPMAQAHQAATGQARAFFDFRFVWRLIRARLTGYVGLAALIGLMSLILNIVVLMSVAQDFQGNSAATPAEGLAFFQQYLFLCTLLLLFPAWLLLHGVAAALYSSAVFKVLRQGTVTRSELNPVLAGWLERLGLTVIPKAQTMGLGWYARLTARFAYRRVLFTVLFFLWVAFIVRCYTGLFFRAHPWAGFLNHPMVQMPCFDYIPPHLYAGRNE